MLLDRAHLAEHRAWIAVTTFLALGAVGWALADTFRSADLRWPGGGSLPGLTFGAAGGLIIGFEMLLWPRKYLWRGRRGWPILFFIPLGATRRWMKAHIWLGLLTLPLLLLHGGFRLDPRNGASLAVVLSWLLVLVVASGVWGVLQQRRLPGRLYQEVPDETIHAQIGHVLQTYRDEARRLVASTSGGDGPAEGQSFMAAAISPRVAMNRSARAALEPLPQSDSLRLFYNRYAEPYLAAPIAAAGALALADPARATELLRLLKLDLPPAAHPAAERLVELCARRRQFDLQDRLFRRLHAWLALHFGLSLALFLLMIAHAVLALRYL